MLEHKTPRERLIMRAVIDCMLSEYEIFSPFDITAGQLLHGIYTTLENDHNHRILSRILSNIRTDIVGDSTVPPRVLVGLRVLEGVGPTEVAEAARLLMHFNCGVELDVPPVKDRVSREAIVITGETTDIDLTSEVIEHLRKVAATEDKYSPLSYEDAFFPAWLLNDEVIDKRDRQSALELLYTAHASFALGLMTDSAVRTLHISAGTLAHDVGGAKRGFHAFLNPPALDISALVTEAREALAEMPNDAEFYTYTIGISNELLDHINSF